MALDNTFFLYWNTILNTSQNLYWNTFSNTFWKSIANTILNTKIIAKQEF